MATTAIGGIGFAITVVNTVLTTLSKIEETARTMKEYESQVDNLSGRLWTITARLDYWNRRWERFCNDRYADIWGEHYPHLQSCRLNIKSLCEELKTEIEALVEGIELYTDESLRELIKSARFTLFVKGKLREKLTFLHERVEQLTAFSQSAEMRHVGDSAEEQTMETERGWRWGMFHDTICQYANALNVGAWELCEECSWSLEMTTPDDYGPDISEWDSTANVNFDFNVLHGAGHDKVGFSRFRIHYNSAWSRKRFKYISSLPQRALAGNIPDGQYQNLEPIHLRSYPLRTLLKMGIFSNATTYKAWEKDRMALMVGMANWTMLLWQSNWTRYICTCGIRFSEIRLQSQAMVRRHALTEESCSHRHKRVYYKPSSMQLLRLGVALAELTLGSPITVVDTDSTVELGPLTFYTYRIERDHEEVERAGLLQRIRQTSPHTKLKDVIAYCLDTTAPEKPELSFLQGYLTNVWHP